jgi:hypothetical protein
MIDLKLAIGFRSSADLTPSFSPRDQLLAKGFLEGLPPRSTGAHLGVNVERPGSNSPTGRLGPDDRKSEVAAVHHCPPVLSVAPPLNVISGDGPVSEDEIEHEPGAFIRHCLDGCSEFRRDFERGHEL